MAFHSHSRFGPPYSERGGPNFRHVMAGQRMMVSGGRDQFGGMERFPPAARAFRGQFGGSRGPRLGFEQFRGGPRGRGFVPGSQVPRPERITNARDGHSTISSLQNNEMMEKSQLKGAVKSEGYSNAPSWNDQSGGMNYMERQPYKDTKSIVKQEEGITVIKLDEYNCDLHFNTDESGLEGWTLHKDGFECLWGGGRATHGIKRGKVAFEVVVLEALPVQVPETERNPHVLRVGWSVDGADLQLGEDNLSYGYGGTGKISVNSRFSDYGQPFSVGDVITCCVDLDTKPCTIFYLLNGEYLGVAFKIGNELGERALFPHVTIKNMKFQVNFGGAWPRYPITPGFAMLQNVPHQDLVKAQEGPKSRQDAEVIMMVGLPSCGKTFWAEKYCKDNPEKRFYMLGTNNIIDKMRIFGLTRKRNYHGRWDALIKQATGCLNTWFKIAEKRVHNYIIDQTNVYFTARRRKMNNFRGYRRTAVVIINEHKVLADRSEKVLREEGKVIPESAVMEMKANFSLPEVGESFDEVKYAEMQPPRAMELVEAFVSEGQAFKKDHGNSREGQEPRNKAPRFEPQKTHGETQMVRMPNRDWDSWNRARQPLNDGRNYAGGNDFSAAELGRREGQHDWNRGIRESNSGPQEGYYNRWDGRQRGSDRSDNERMGLAASGYRYESAVKSEPVDSRQGYGHNDRRDYSNARLKPTFKAERDEWDRNYSETSSFGYRQPEGYRGRSTDSSIVGEREQSNQYQGYSAESSNAPYQGYSQSSDEQYSHSNQRFYGRQADRYLTGNSQMGKPYTQSAQQQSYHSEYHHSWEQDYQREAQPVQQSHAYEQGAQGMQRNAESVGQGFGAGWQAPYSSQPEYPRQPSYTGQQGQQRYSC